MSRLSAVNARCDVADATGNVTSDIFGAKTWDRQLRLPPYSAAYDIALNTIERKFDSSSSCRG